MAILRGSRLCSSSAAPGLVCWSLLALQTVLPSSAQGKRCDPWCPVRVVEKLRCHGPLLQLAAAVPADSIYIPSGTNWQHDTATIMLSIKAHTLIADL